MAATLFIFPLVALVALFGLALRQQPLRAVRLVRRQKSWSIATPAGKLLL